MAQPSTHVLHARECSPVGLDRLAGADAEGSTPQPLRTRPVAVRPLLLLLSLIVAVFASFPATAHATYSCSGATLAKGQLKINQGYYTEAINVFSCVIAADPASVDGYRGRIEAQLLLDRYSDAVRDYARVTAFVLPVHPDAQDTILEGYATRLAASPWNVPALTGASFARWWFFDYAGAVPLLDKLLTVSPNNLYGNLFRGSNRLFVGTNVTGGKADLTRAIQLSPWNPHVRYIVSDAYTYAFSDPSRAEYEATLALQWGLDTPRVHAILASAATAMEDDSDAAYHLKRHIDLVTTQLVSSPTIAVGCEAALELVPGRTYEIPITLSAGQMLSLETGSPSEEIYDSILVLIGPNGSPVVGSDDYVDYFAGLDWVAPTSGTYKLRVTSFESVNTGELVVTRF